MSGNKLLAENTIRRFMKLANVDAMTDNFISEMGMKGYKKNDAYGRDPEESMEEANEELEENEEINEEEEDEMDMDPELGAEEPEEEPAMDMDPEVDAEPEMGAADMSLTEEEAQLLIDLGSRLAEAMGGEMGGEPDPDPAADIDEPEMDMGAEEDEAADDEEEPMMQEDLVNEVLKRVTKRLVAAKLKNRK